MNENDIVQILDKLDISDNESKLSRRNHSERMSPGQGGPQGLGDPADKSLDKYEKETLIPQRVYDTAKGAYCSDLK